MIGRHIRTLTPSEFKSSPSYARELGCNVMQIFLGNPQESVSKSRTESELKDFANELKINNIQVVIHGHYTVNLCHDLNSSRFRSSARCLISDLRASEIVGAIGVIIHMGKNVNNANLTDLINRSAVNPLNENEAIENFVIGLKKIILSTSDLNAKIILETGAGVGKEVGTQIDKLAEIYAKLNNNEKARVGFCIDTCHIWSAGYDISTEIGVKDFFSMWDKLIGVDKILCAHFNNSKTGLGSRVDRHADLISGQIDIHGMEAVAKFFDQNKIPIIMETPLDTIDKKTNNEITFEDEFKLVKKLIKNKHT